MKDKMQQFVVEGSFLDELKNLNPCGTDKKPENKHLISETKKMPISMVHGFQS